APRAAAGDSRGAAGNDAAGAGAAAAAGAAAEGAQGAGAAATSPTDVGEFSTCGCPSQKANQPPHFPMLGGRLPSPRGGPVLPSPRGFPRALPPGMPGLWEARPSPRVQHQFPPDHVEPADDRSGSDDPSEPEVDDEEPFEGGNGSEGGKDSGDELEAGGGAEDYPSGEEGGSFSSGSSAERARAQERAKQREEAEAAVEGGVEEGELLSEEEGALASGDDGGIPSIPSSRSASVEPMDEEPAPSSDEPMSFAASDGPFGAQAAAGALFGGLDFRALADDSYGEDQPGTSGAPGFDAETGSAKPGNGKREVLTELHTLGRSMGRDVTYRFIKVANGPPVTAQVLMQGRVVGEGHGPNKRLAKHNGARQVLEMLQGQGGSRPVPLPGLPNQGHPAPPHPVPGQQNAPRPSRPPPMQEVRNVYHGQAVEFEELASEGPPHKKTFTFQVKVDGVPVAVASGPSKKVAKQHASQEAIRRKPMMDQMWHAQPAQAPPPHPPSAKRPASDSEPDPAPAVKRVRTSDTAFGVSPTPTAESLFPAVPGGAFPAGGHPLQGTAAFGGFQESVAQGAPLTPGQWAGGQFPLPGGQGPGAPAAVGRGRGVLSPGKKAGKGGALGAKKKLKQSAKTKTRRDTPELTAAKRDSAPIFVQDSEVMR
ncbi:RNA polymerase II c-terminal domain phosphatase-like, partial [Klebsormidium nitens]